jgi:hypothetical protein
MHQVSFEVFYAMSLRYFSAANITQLRWNGFNAIGTLDTSMPLELLCTMNSMIFQLQGKQ